MEEDNCTTKAVVVDKHISGNLTGVDLGFFEGDPSSTIQA